MKYKKIIIIVIGILILTFIGFKIFKKVKINPNKKYTIGQVVDSLNGVYVYYNGSIGNIDGRNLSDDGYNIGLKYQCVEFVKRYYYEHLSHKMPDSYGHAVDFFNANIKDGELNKQRNLIQYTNPSKSKPQVSDLLIYSGTAGNKYGHVAIVSKVMDNEIEIIQQNPGPFGKPRVNFNLSFENNLWKIENNRILGWLRKE